MRRFLLFNIPLLLLPLMQGCMTDDYDLSKDLDASVCFAPGGFSFGGDNSADIPLSEVIELSDSGQLTTDMEGNYLFYKSCNDMQPTTVVNGQGSLSEAYEVSDTMSFGSDATVETMKRYPGYATLSFEKKIHLASEPEYQNESVRELIYVTTPMTITVKTLIDSSVSSFCNSITLTYQLPSYFDLADPSELTETIKMSEFGKTHEHTFHLKGVDFTKHGAGEHIGIVRPDNYIIVEGDMTITGKAIVSTADYATAMKNNPVAGFHVFVGSMATALVTGRFDEVESVDINPIALDNLPDFIRDADVVVDVDNPVVHLSLDSEVPANVFLDAKLKGYKDGCYISQVNAGKQYGTAPILFYGPTDGQQSRRTNVWISRKAIDVPDSVSSNVVVNDMNNLIRKLPDRVDVEATARTDSSQVVTLSLTKEYKAVPSYELVAPLKIGPEMKIVYTKEITDLHDHLKDMELDGFVFSGDVANNIPLDLHIVATPLDENGNVVDGININTSDIIPANSTKAVSFTMENGNGKAIQKIYTISMKAYAESNDAIAGQYLNKNQNLKISHATITLKGAKYNLNGK